ncbi:unnamed protein product [Pylaiella littoralis]
MGNVTRLVMTHGHPLIRTYRRVSSREISGPSTCADSRVDQLVDQGHGFAPRGVIKSRPEVSRGCFQSLPTGCWFTVNVTNSFNIVFSRGFCELYSKQVFE